MENAKTTHLQLLSAHLKMIDQKASSTTDELGLARGRIKTLQEEMDIAQAQIKTHQERLSIGERKERQTFEEMERQRVENEKEKTQLKAQFAKAIEDYLQEKAAHDALQREYAKIVKQREDAEVALGGGGGGVVVDHLLSSTSAPLSPIVASFTGSGLLPRSSEGLLPRSPLASEVDDEDSGGGLDPLPKSIGVETLPDDTKGNESKDGKEAGHSILSPATGIFPIFFSFFFSLINRVWGR